MNIREKIPAVMLTVWIVAAGLIYFRQFAGPALRYLARVTGRG